MAVFGPRLRAGPIRLTSMRLGASAGKSAAEPATQKAVAAASANQSGPALTW